MKESKWALFCVMAGLLIFSSRVIGQDGSAASLQLAKAHHQGQFNALLEGGFQSWDKGYLITYGQMGIFAASPNKAAVTLYNRNGQVAREAVVWFDGAESVSVIDAAISPSGHLVVAGGSSSEGAIANFIAEIGNAGRVDRVVRTTPFMPVYVCALEDSTFWSYGLERNEHLAGVQNSLRLRQYSFEKGQLHAMLDTSVLNSGGWALSHGRYPGEMSLRCNAQTVVLYNGASGDLIEVDIKSGVLKLTRVAQLPAPPEFRITGFALTESGEIFASFNDRTQLPQKPVLSGLFRLQRDNAGSAKWTPVEGTVGPYLHGSLIQRLLGADGDDLVYTSVKNGKVFWSKQERQ